MDLPPNSRQPSAMADLAADDESTEVRRVDEEGRRQEFLHRMTQVRIGGHQADHREVTAANNLDHPLSARKPPMQNSAASSASASSGAASPAVGVVHRRAAAVAAAVAAAASAGASNAPPAVASSESSPSPSVSSSMATAEDAVAMPLPHTAYATNAAEANAMATAADNDNENDNDDQNGDGGAQEEEEHAAVTVPVAGSAEAPLSDVGDEPVRSSIGTVSVTEEDLDLESAPLSNDHVLPSAGRPPARAASAGIYSALLPGGSAAAPAPPSAAAAKRVQSMHAFPPFPDNPVLKTVCIPSSDQFPVKDAQIGPHHFTRLKLLGRGGIGQVFLVRLRATDRLYAMKVLTKEEMILRNKVKRVMTEREILATANHPFIVTMYASFQTADRLCFVMEYCAGGEFFRVLQRQPKKRLKEDAVRFYAAEVILALEYLHHMGFIYRDLKPENILIRENGHIALTDFDLSKQAHAVSPRVVQQQLSLGDKLRKSLSMKRNNSSLPNLEIVDSEPVLPYQTNSFVGTEEYIAPEVVNGVGQSSAVDWWTLGILIYEMLTGTTPFKGSYTDETFNNIVREQVRWPEDINASNDCKQLVKKLLRREADKRLGAENGASDIKRSKWFKDFNFALIRNETPPIIPKIRDPKDLSQYKAMSDEEDVAASAAERSSYTDDNNPENPFVNFNMRRNKSLQRQY